MLSQARNAVWGLGFSESPAYPSLRIAQKRTSPLFIHADGSIVAAIFLPVFVPAVTLPASMGLFPAYLDPMSHVQFVEQGG